MDEASYKNYASILNWAAYFCSLAGLAVLAAGLWLLYLAIGENASGKAFLAGGVLVLFSFLFFLPLWLRKSKGILLYFRILGGLLFASYAFASFQSLSQAGTPGAQFALLALIACFGLWLLMVGSNSEIRRYMQNLSKQESGQRMQNKQAASNASDSDN